MNFEELLKRMGDILHEVSVLAEKERKASSRVLKDASRILDDDDCYGDKIASILKKPGVMGSLCHFYMIGEMGSNTLEAMAHSFKLGAYLALRESERTAEMKASLGKTFEILEEMMKNGQSDGAKNTNS